MRPPKNLQVPFDMLFPLLCYHFAQSEDPMLGGEYAVELNWKKILQAIDVQRKITIPFETLDSLLYSYKLGVIDQRPPFKFILKWCSNSYLPLMKEYKKWFPDLFKEDPDGEILLQGHLPSEVPPHPAPPFWTEKNKKNES